MNGAAWAAHQAHRSRVRRMFSLTSRSPSRSVVAEMAPMCTTAATSPAWAASQGRMASGRTMSCRATGATLRHLSPTSSQSTTTTRRPWAARAAAMLEPMNPAPPVTT